MSEISMAPSHRNLVAKKY